MTREIKVYKQPLYYEIAFSFIDARKQVDMFEKYMRRFSRIRVRRVLDICCGPSLQLREIAKRGYEAIGLDSSADMLRHLSQKAREEKVKIQTVQADMNDFSLKKKADFAFIMMGSFTFRSNHELLRHLGCVSKSLNRGGLYLIEDFSLDWPNTFKPQSWEMKVKGVKVKASYEATLKDALTQMYKERIVLDVDEICKKQTFVQDDTAKIVLPQEFLSLVELDGSFEFLGWFERFKVKPLRKASNDNIVVLRKK